ncbi:MAG: RbsD/FucU domain-containing protein [Bacillota bacterium]
MKRSFALVRAITLASKSWSGSFVVATGEVEQCANIILKKGVIVE